MDVENEALASGAGPNISNAYTINGMPGRLYSCSSDSKSYKHCASSIETQVYLPS